MAVAVYNAEAGEDAEAAWALLDAAGLEPVYLNDPAPMLLPDYHVRELYLVSIGVPDANAEQAVSLMSAFDAEKTERVHRYNGALFRALALFIALFTAFVVGIYLLSTSGNDLIMLSMLVAVSSMMTIPFFRSAVRQVRRRRLRRR